MRLDNETKRRTGCIDILAHDAFDNRGFACSVQSPTSRQWLDGEPWYGKWDDHSIKMRISFSFNFCFLTNDNMVGMCPTLVTNGTFQMMKRGHEIERGACVSNVSNLSPPFTRPEKGTSFKAGVTFKLYCRLSI